MMDWIKFALWALVFVQCAFALYYDWRDDDIKCIKYFMFAMGLYIVGFAA